MKQKILLNLTIVGLYLGVTLLPAQADQPEWTCQNACGHILTLEENVQRVGRFCRDYHALGIDQIEVKTHITSWRTKIVDREIKDCSDACMKDIVGLCKGANSPK